VLCQIVGFSKSEHNSLKGSPDQLLKDQCWCLQHPIGILNHFDLRMSISALIVNSEKIGQPSERCS